MQKQMLWHSFQEKNKQLEMEQEKQMAHTIKVFSRGVERKNVPLGALIAPVAECF